MSEAAIVLCGGRSRRMGRDKGALPFGDENMLERMVRIVGSVTDEVVIVAREGQPVTGDFAGARSRPKIVRDPAEGLGPLAGIAAGLAAVSAERSFLCSCDLPLLEPAVVRFLFDLAHDHPIAVPFLAGHHLPTAAIYHRDLLPLARSLLDQERRRPLFLIEAVAARIVTEDELRTVDPELSSFLDCNTPESYKEALALAGLADPASGAR
jgi:molybdopterin-guanine dinucleotide biosynthesis protein A